MSSPLTVATLSRPAPSGPMAPKMNSDPMKAAMTKKSATWRVRR
jgi:hypothetical protein